MTGDQDPAFRDRIRKNAVIKADSACNTYNQHFLAANFYRWLNRFLDTVLFTASLLLVSQAVWTAWPRWTTIVLPLGMAVITGYRRAAKPDNRAERFRKSAKQHHALFDDYRDFLMVTLPSNRVTDAEIEETSEELSERRKELNLECPDASSLWYYWIKYVRGEEKLQEQISTTPEMREAIVGRSTDPSQEPLD
ncbi:hypothetical protein HTZ84_21080 [Haloterrigena sp. SYSU A558-1]|uniref:Uncharacterized protein n=1 Tax=Haloterrigena gelatinilytica TaxID=2741724 RepID=A0ABX2LNQ5_9EURY|nr:hypothetical protein [Haloterrigena gelatinilytica]NUC74759.1 hypothetical protein [Haloterrigena gelatinilytica]